MQPARLPRPARRIAREGRLTALALPILAASPKRWPRGCAPLSA
jgi:hypothetical protein